MELINLTELEIIDGIISLIFVLISLLIGIKLLLKYFTLQKKVVFITIGLTWIFISIIWWDSAFSFLFLILFNYQISMAFSIISEFVFIPLVLLSWIYSFSSLVYTNIKNKIVLFYIAMCVILEVIPTILIALTIETIPADFNFINENVEIYLICIHIFTYFTIFSFLITGIIFSKQSLISNELKLRWKGRFLLMAFISITIGLIIEVLSIPSLELTIIIRIILITSGINYYLGFFLPDRVFNFLSKREENDNNKLKENGSSQ